MKMHRGHAWDSCIQHACLLPKCPLMASQVRGTLNPCHQSVPLHAIYNLSCKVPQTRNTYIIGIMFLILTNCRNSQEGMVTSEGVHHAVLIEVFTVAYVHIKQLLLVAIE